MLESNSYFDGRFQTVITSFPNIKKNTILNDLELSVDLNKIWSFLWSYDFKYLRIIFFNDYKNDFFESQLFCYTNELQSTSSNSSF